MKSELPYICLKFVYDISKIDSVMMVGVNDLQYPCYDSLVISLLFPLHCL